MNPKKHDMPTALLTELEREPIVYFGCTWTEINRQLLRSAGIAIMLAIVIAATIVFLGFRFPAVFSSFSASFLILTFLITRLTLRRIAKYRIGKPLFFERHIGIYKSNQFFQPKHIIFQRERNNGTQK